MEHQDADHMQQPRPVSCRTGCGFYASQSTEGMCSVCYKEYVKKKQAPPVNMPASLAPNSSSARNACNDLLATTPPSSSSMGPSSSAVSSQMIVSSDSSQLPTTPPSVGQLGCSMDANVISPTSADFKPQPSAAVSDCKSAAVSPDNSRSTPIPTGTVETTDCSPSSSTNSSPASPSKGRKGKSRCLICKAKVGLTGFTCRCGGLYCSLHRYSDTHDCQFDYHELAAAEIRRSNPVVVAKKVDKI